ncbi:MAG: exonuclease domain-containing protein [Coriobacteriia bacterium]|nr:exonuclease domain-containing protein [Coriobacteriia bacterium]
MGNVADISPAVDASDIRFGFEPQVCILDVETTGLSSERDAIIEIAIARMEGPDIIDRFTTLVNPERPLHKRITEITTITDADLVDAPTIENVAPQIRDFIKDTPLVAHNAAFDRGFVEAACGELPGPWIDTVELARIAWPHLLAHRLDALVAEYLPDFVDNLHRASADVEALALLWRMMLAEISTYPLDVLSAMATVAEPTKWPAAMWLQLISTYQNGLAGVDKPSAFNLRTVRARCVKEDKQHDFEDAYEHPTLTFPEFTTVASSFSPDELVGKMYPKSEARQEQADMAVEVNDAFTASYHLAIEAGTGVGKSLAYLVPAALAAQQNNITVGIATKTNALSDQLIHRELPLLNEALGGSLRYTALKGYEHYICLRRLDAQLGDKSMVSSLAPYEICFALAWVARNTWGDLSMLNFYWRVDAHRELVARPLDCAKQKCRFYPNFCYLHGARIRARSSHIVVTNHALVCRDAASQATLLPPVRYLVLDEAHGIESEARRQLSAGIDSRELATQIRNYRREHAGLIAQLKRAATGLPKDSTADSPAIDLIAAFETEVADAETLLPELINATAALAASDRPGFSSSEIFIAEPARANAPWQRVEEAASRLLKTITAAAVRGQSVVAAFEESNTELPAAVGDFIRSLMIWQEFAVGIEEILAPSEANRFRYASVMHPRDPARPIHVQLTVAHIEVGSLIAENLLESTNSTIFTSATLAAGNDFAPFLHATGLEKFEDVEPMQMKTIQLASSFDLDEQMRIFIARDMPEPRDPAYHEALERFLYDIHVATKGGVLTLFTSRVDLTKLHTNLRGPLAEQDIPLLAQRDRVGQKRIRDRFVGECNTSLMATKTFWEGFDAVGDTLRCVVIPRLPFKPPTDPLSLARKTIDAQWWEHYMIPDMLIELKQATGRLIRSRSDRGFVVIADSRAANARYADVVQSALPVEPVVATCAEIGEMLCEANSTCGD